MQNNYISLDFFIHIKNKLITINILIICDIHSKIPKLKFSKQSIMCYNIDILAKN
jgi:hypothetical protein